MSDKITINIQSINQSINQSISYLKHIPLYFSCDICLHLKTFSCLFQLRHLFTNKYIHVSTTKTSNTETNNMAVSIDSVVDLSRGNGPTHVN